MSANLCTSIQRDFLFILFLEIVLLYGYTMIYLTSSLLTDISKASKLLLLQKNATINYLDFSHVNTCLWDWFLEVRLLGQSVWAFLILIHINKLLSTEDLPVLSPAIHGSFQFPRALPQSALSKLLDFFQFDRQNWYFNRILVWISIITSDCRPFLCLVLFVFSLFILQIYTLSPFFYCIVGLFLIDL